MNVWNFKFLTAFLILGIFVYSEFTFAGILEVKEFKTHLRWELRVPKNQILINKFSDYLTIETLDRNLYDAIKKQLRTHQLNNKYIKSVEFPKNFRENSASRIKVMFIDQNVDLFSFYKVASNSYVVDFWSDKIQIDKKVAEVKSDKVKPIPQKIIAEKSIPRKIKKVKKVIPEKLALKIESPSHRDFRYGASFIWDYKPLVPKLKTMVNVDRKTPEYFYPIKNRNYMADEKEAHLQLSINLFKKEKYGLMNKSLNLFEKKYGEDSYRDFSDYLRANALLREFKEKKEKGVKKSAINLLFDISERSKDYELQKACLQFIVQTMIDDNDFIQAIQFAKKLYVITKKNFDREISEYAVEVILNGLAQLQQIEKINAFLDEPVIKKLINPQIGMAYQMYAYLSKNLPKKVVGIFEEKLKDNKSLLPSVLFNVAEAYFRLSDFNSAVKYFDQYIANYSFQSYSSFARVRLSLSYELLDQDIEKVNFLYRESLSLATIAQARYEAKLRYVALNLARKKNVTHEDRELEVYLEFDSEEKLNLNQDLKKLLWLVRLRTFINRKQYRKSLTYLTSLPLDAMNSVEKRTFDGDGAEIIYGLLLDSYKNGDYPGVVRLWEVYSPKYNLKVAQDSHVNFIVTNSYLKLRMYKSFDRSFDRFKKLQKTVHRTFPIWIERREDESAENLLSEIKVLKELYAMKWDLADEALESLKDVKSFYPKFHYYKSLISYKRKKFEVSSENAELFIVKNKRDDLLSDEEFANLLEAYYESTYALGKLDKFKTVVMAFLKDFEKKKKRTQFIEDSVEKISYLLIETLAGENNKESYVQLEEIIKNFLKRYSKSVYSGRTKFLYGVSLVNNDKESEGIKILTKLLSDESVPKYIQELARTEISSIKLKNNSI